MEEPPKYLPDLLLLALATYQFVHGIQPPHQAAQQDRAKARGKDWISQRGLTKAYLPAQGIAIGLALWAGKSIVKKGGYAEAAAAASSSSNRRRSSSSTDALLWRRLFYLGTTLMALGGWGRSRCHRELGKFFTFDLAVQKGQKVIQSGPYAYVRHPAYFCTYIMLIGSFLSLGIAHPGVNAKWKRYMTYTMVLRHGLDLWLFLRRVTEEEEMLQRELGKEYTAYMKKVPHRIIPGIF